MEKSFDTGYDQSVSNAPEIDLLDMFYSLLKNLKKILLVGLAVMVLLGAYSLTRKDELKYTSIARLYMNNVEKNIPEGTSYLEMCKGMGATYLLQINTIENRIKIRDNLQLEYSYNDLNNMTELSCPSNTRIINISVTSTDRYEAQAIANEYANLGMAAVNKNEPDALSISAAAHLPEEREAESPLPGVVKNAVIGFVLGVFLAAVYFALRFLLDGTLRTPGAIQKNLGIATLAMIPAEAPQAKKAKAAKEA